MNPSRRPSWFACEPDFELDCRDAASTGAPSLKAIIDEAERVPEGRMMAIRIGFEPTFLCRIMNNRGFRHWPEQDASGEWKIYFLRATW
jgi:hypothetical protein